MGLLQPVDTKLDRRVVKIYFYDEPGGYDSKVEPSGVMILEIDDNGFAVPSAFILREMALTRAHWREFIGILKDLGVIELLPPERPTGHTDLSSAISWINSEITK